MQFLRAHPASEHAAITGIQAMNFDEADYREHCRAWSDARLVQALMTLSEVYWQQADSPARSKNEASLITYKKRDVVRDLLMERLER